MNADLAGALEQLNDSWRAFTHNGKPMTKDEVRKCLVYGLKKGYDSTADFKPGEIDEILTPKKDPNDDLPF